MIDIFEVLCQSQGREETQSRHNNQGGQNSAGNITNRALDYNHGKMEEYSRTIVNVFLWSGLSNCLIAALDAIMWTGQRVLEEDRS